MGQSRWKTLRERNLAEGLGESEDVSEVRRETRLSMELAQAVYVLRTELGLTQAELADRAGLTQAEILRMEGSDAVPTPALLAGLAGALAERLRADREVARQIMGVDVSDDAFGRAPDILGNIYRIAAEKARRRD
ncbi:helix-turn-helix domain-containing protein [Streptomyces sp. B-S-A8]|uniref:Helix-turn-helix domain-containing protein n=1 Tax=Streptomyces solicavernae TaxID=3043614 RepID=A0ABT6RQQ8_9ACTN|nr:helix-turn-helix domain-containing protein [Streptomyces sp. B-S-A8]MDI3386544.1 helix-turn-helix domain-containing protein [Streptomyces sp. B-S-A8]